MPPRDPGNGLDVAQAARTLLDVRLQVVAGVVELVMAGALLRHLGLEELRLDQIRLGPVRSCIRASRSADPAYEPALHEVGGHGDVAPRLVHALAYGPYAVSDRKPDVPQEREKIPDLLAFTATHRPGCEDEQVDVGARVQLAAAVAADRDQRAAGVTVESEPVPGEHEDAVHDPRTGLDERGNRVAPAEARLQARPRCRDGVANFRQWRAHVTGSGKRSGYIVRTRFRGRCAPVVHRALRSLDVHGAAEPGKSQRARSNLARSRSQSRFLSAARLSCCFLPRAIARRTFARLRVQCMSRAIKV